MMYRLPPEELYKYTDKVPLRFRNIYYKYNESDNKLIQCKSLADVKYNDIFCLYEDNKLKWFIATSAPYLNDYSNVAIGCKKINERHFDSIEKC